MEQSSMTALVSLFARAYHAKNKKVKVFDDSKAAEIITPAEYEQISFHMTQGIGFFEAGFTGTEEETLRRVVEKYLSPSPLGRAAFAEAALENAVHAGARQYLILAAGFDTFACRQPAYGQKLEIFEIDHPLTSAEKQKRVRQLAGPPIANLHFVAADLTTKDWQYEVLKQPAFDKDAVSFCSILGLCYYLAKEDWIKVLRALAEILAEGSRIVFDYPLQAEEGEAVGKMASLAKAANEEMKAAYQEQEMNQILAQYGFGIDEQLAPSAINQRFFAAYNEANPVSPIFAAPQVNYCLAVKKSTAV